MAQHYESLSPGAEAGRTEMEGAKGFGPHLTFSSLILQALLNAALYPTAALFWPMCVRIDVCASAKEPPAADTQVEVGLRWKGCFSVPVSSGQCWLSAVLSVG